MKYIDSFYFYLFCVEFDPINKSTRDEVESESSTTSRKGQTRSLDPAAGWGRSVNATAAGYQPASQPRQEHPPVRGSKPATRSLNIWWMRCESETKPKWKSKRKMKRKRERGRWTKFQAVSWEREERWKGGDSYIAVTESWNGYFAFRENLFIYIKPINLPKIIPR